jgi:cyclomaltodextrinase / maltogenic alpha-amylase / neopullulanase
MWVKTRFLIILLCLIAGLTDAQIYSPPGWSYDKTIYEVNIRQFSPGGTFKELEDHLPRLNEMGAGILWLMPIHPIGDDKRKGTLGSYYSVKDYKGINPEFGTADDLKSLVKKIHAMGMFVIIDWVASHTAWNHRWITERPDYYRTDSLGNIVSPVPDWSDVADLNFDNKALWAEMIDALTYWVKEFDIDGYRCDVAGMVPIEFWIESREELEKIKNVFMLAEWDTPEMHLAFDMSYDWNAHHLMNQIAKGEKNVRDFVNHLDNNKNQYPPNAFRMQFTDNHDENSWNGTVFERLGDAVESFAVLTFMIPGTPLIYSGQEAGLNKRLAFFDKDSIDWNEHPFTELYTRLTRLKMKGHSLLSGSLGADLIEINSNQPEKVLAFTRGTRKDKVLALFNLSPYKSDFNLIGENLKGSYKNYFTDDAVSFEETEYFQLEPWEYKIFINYIEP